MDARAWSMFGLLCMCIVLCSRYVPSASSTTPVTSTETTASTSTAPSSSSPTLSDQHPLHCENTKYNISDHKPVSGFLRLAMKCPFMPAGYVKNVLKHWSNNEFSIGTPDNKRGELIVTLIYQTANPNTNTTTKIPINLIYNGTTITATLEIHVMDINDAPILKPMYYQIVEGQLKQWWIPVHDVDAGPIPSRNKTWGDLTVTVTGMPPNLKIVKHNRTHFSLNLVKPLDAENPKWSTLPVESFKDYERFPLAERSSFRPAVSFIITVKDGGGLSTDGKVTIEINDINDNMPFCDPIPPIKAPRNKTLIHPKNPIIDLFNYCRDLDVCIGCRLELRYLGIQECNKAFTLNNLFHDRTAPLLPGSDYPPTNKAKCNVSLVFMDDQYATPVSFEVIFQECPVDVDRYNVTWEAGWPGRYTNHTCPSGYSGSVLRFCGNDGVYEPPFFDCTSTKIADIVKVSGHFNSNISEILDELASATVTNTTDQPLLAGDVQTVTTIMGIITNKVITADSSSTGQISTYLDVANNLMQEANNYTWKSVINKTGSGVDQVLTNIDMFIEIVMAINTPVDVNESYAKSNLYLNFGRMNNCQKDLSFPNKDSSNIPLWAKDTADNIFMPCGKDTEAASYSAVMYRDLRQIIPEWGNTGQRTTNESLNSPVMSMSLYPMRREPLNNPVTITFQLYSNAKADYVPKCSYWKIGFDDTVRTEEMNFQTSTEQSTIQRFGEELGPDDVVYENDTEQIVIQQQAMGYWSTDGCELSSYDADKGIVVCKCNHLTNFAILMSPSTAAAEHTKALSIISLIGCIVSMIFLVVTLAVHVYYWRIVGGERTILLLNLCVTLFLAYLIFLAGVEQVSNKDACTFVGVLLHYIYLVVFFTMLAIGVLLAKTVIKPFNKTPIAKWGLLTSYGGAAIIVGISMAATQLDGYGSSTSCWLSINKGLIWTFIVPVLVVVAINIVIIIIVLRQMFGTTAVSNKSNSEKTKMGLRSLCVLMPVLGVTWVFGVLSVNEDTVVFQYLFCIFNSLQGLLIFIFHCVLNKKIKDAFSKSFKKVPSHDMSLSDKNYHQLVKQKTQSTTNTDS